MKDFLVLGITGFITFILGIVVLKREKRLFDNPVSTIAKVVTYYEYEKSDVGDGMPLTTMYTMAAEYRLKDGTLIHAREQSGSSNKKYPVGTELEIIYSREQPDLFIVKGDHSRKIAMIGMMIGGLALMAMAVYVGLNR